MEVMPENHRMKWTDEENKQLLDEIESKMTFRQIASIHKRTICAIKYKIIRNVIEDISDMRDYEYNFKFPEPTIEQIMEVTNLPKQDIIDLFKKLKFDYHFDDKSEYVSYAWLIFPSVIGVGLMSYLICNVKTY